MSPLLALLGCSLGTTGYTPCETHAECRDAFGFGAVCAEDGLCAEVDVDPRCERTFPTDVFDRPENYDGAYVLGALLNHAKNRLEIQAAELAVLHANDQGGLDGRPFALVVCDYQSSLDIDDLTVDEAAERGAGFLAETLEVPAIIGPGTSATAEIVYGVAAPAGTLTFSPSASSPYLTHIDGTEEKTDAAPGLFWRTVASDALQGKAVAQDIREVLGKTEVAVVYQRGPYGNGLLDAFVRVFQGLGGQVLALPYTDTVDLSNTLHDARAEPPEEVLFISSNADDVLAFLAILDTWQDWAGVGIHLTDTARTQDVLDQVPVALLPRLRGTAPAAPDSPLYHAFLTAYTAAYAPDNAASAVYTAHTWDATWLAMAGVAWAVSNEDGVTGVGIARGLRRVSDTKPDPLALGSESWTSIVGSFQDGAAVDIAGASGDLDFDPVDEETTAPVEVWSVADGMFRTEYTVSP